MPMLARSAPIVTFTGALHGRDAGDLPAGDHGLRNALDESFRNGTS